MNKDKYFTELLSLLEDVGMSGSEEVVPQEGIADSGSDVMPKNEYQEASESEGEEQTDDMQDEMPESMNAELPSGSNIENVMKSQKLLKLYNLYNDLLNYCTVFLDTLANIDTNTLELETFKLVRKYIQSVKELADKINNYMINIYSQEEYNKVLYVYILFRTELITCIKGLRSILKLNEINDKKNEKKE